MRPADESTTAPASHADARTCQEALRSLPQAEEEYQRAELALRHFPPSDPGRFVEVNGTRQRHPDDVATLQDELRRQKRTTEEARRRVLFLRESVRLGVRALLPTAVPLGLGAAAVQLSQLVAAWNLYPDFLHPTPGQTLAEAIGFLEMLAVAVAQADPPPPAGRCPARGKITQEEAEARARDFLETVPGFAHLGAREWAIRIGCPLGMVPNLAAWQDVMSRTGRGRKVRGGRPRTVAFSDRMEEAAGGGGGILNELIKESEKENASDPSPLDPHPRRGPRIRRR
jgi:hypothetical protein